MCRRPLREEAAFLLRPLALSAVLHVFVELLDLQSHLVEVVLGPDAHRCFLKNLLKV
jgi:hypothetical protein